MVVIIAGEMLEADEHHQVSQNTGATNQEAGDHKKKIKDAMPKEKKPIDKQPKDKKKPTYRHEKKKAENMSTSFPQPLPSPVTGVPSPWSFRGIHFSWYPGRSLTGWLWN